EVQVLRGHVGPVTCVAVSADGHRVLSGSKDNTLRLWDADTGKELSVFRGHTNEVTGVALSVDGQRAVSGSLDKTVRVWDLEKEAGGKPLVLRNDEWVHAVAISIDGKRVLSGGVDKLVHLWDVEKGTRLRSYEGNGYFVRSVAFSGDGGRVIS